MNRNGDHKELKLLVELSAQWTSVAVLLGFEKSRIDAIQSVGKPPESCLLEVIEHWMNNSVKMEGSYSETWRGLHQLLVDSEKIKTAQHLEAALNADVSSARCNYTEGNLEMVYRIISDNRPWGYGQPPV